MLAFMIQGSLASAAFSAKDKLADTQGKRSLCEATLKDFSRITVPVIKTRDGDTLDVSIKGRKFGVRLLSVDTPESYYEGRTQGEWADLAKMFLRKVLQPKDMVTLEFGREKCDFYGRVLAYVNEGGVDVNAQLLRRGLAVNYCVYPEMSRCREYSGYVYEAILAKRGFWSDPDTQIPYIWRAEVRGTEGAAFVGDLETREVHSMRDLESIDIEKRVFFLTRRNFYVGKKF